MSIDINRLRELIRTGEFLESNLNDEKVRNQWLFDVEDYITLLEPRCRKILCRRLFYWLFEIVV